MRHLAIEPLLVGRESLRFKAIARRRDERKQQKDIPLLSLSSRGFLYPRTGESDRQQASEANLERCLVVSPGDLVINPMWLTGGSIAVSSLRGAVSPDYRVFRLRPEMEPRFVHHLLRSSEYIDQYRLYTRADTTFDRRVQQGDLDELRIPNVPVEEQRRIADFLDDQVARIDNIIAARRRYRELAAQATEGKTVDTLLRGGAVSEAGSLGEYKGLPQGWLVRRLGSVWRVIDCKHRTPGYVEEGYPVISPGDISPGHLDPSIATRAVGLEDYLDLADTLRRCRVGDIVYSRNASAGTAALVADDRPFTMGQDVCRITSANPAQTYLYYVLNHVVHPQIERSRIGSTFTRINIDQIKALHIPVPTYAEQVHISALCDSIVRQQQQIESDVMSHIYLLQELKRSLITAALTGGVDVSAADGSAVVL